MLFSRSISHQLKVHQLSRRPFLYSRTYITLSTTTNPQSPLPILPSTITPSTPKTIIFLGTPQFSTLLPSIHASLTSFGISPKSAFLAGIVDSVPTSHDGTTSRYGYTWLITSQVLDIAPSTLKHTFEFIDPSIPRSLNFPLSNTIFTTGNFSESYYSHTPSSLTSTTGWSTILPVGLTTTTRTHLPLTPLTSPRQITASAGNILRTLNSKPASSELEVAVHSYLSANPSAPKPDIYARIASSADILLQHDDPIRMRKDRGLAYDIFNPKLGSIRKVLSGGGGWGQKSGLLAIDPQSDSDVESYAKDFEEGFYGLKDPSGNSSIVGRGKWVRFYIVDESAEPAAALPEGFEGEARFGCVAKEEEGFLGGIPEGGREEVIEGVWGAGSEEGVTINGVGSLGKRRLDVPGGWVGMGGKKPVKL